MRLILFTLLALVISGARLPAQAQSCSFSIANVNFGNINIGPGGTPSTTSTFTATCSGLANRTITICPNIGDGTGSSTAGSPRLLTNGTRTIGYDLLQPNGDVWGSYVWPYAARPPVLSLTLNGSGSGTLSRTIQAVISGSIAGANTGLYSSSYTTFHTLIDYGYAPGQSCSTVSNRAAQAPFTVQANNVATCNVTTTPMDFGTVADLGTAQSATSQLGITCTRGTNYTVGLSNGINGGTSPTNRKLASASAPGSSITYGIYRDTAFSQPWGQTVGSNTVSGVGTGTQQLVIAYGRMPVQAKPSPASYSDTIVVTVTY